MFRAMKQCYRCKEEKDSSEFGKDRSKKDGLSIYCKECCKKDREKFRERNKKISKEYYEKNKDRLLEVAKVSRQANRERNCKYSKEYYRKNSDKAKEYYEKNKERFKERKKKNGKTYRENNKERLQEVRKNYWQENKYELKKKNQVYNLKLKYGIDKKDYDQMFDNQNGRCAICGVHRSELKRELSVDHDHQTGKVRGLLCHSCNVALGHLQDSKEIILNMLSYLELVA